MQPISSLISGMAQSPGTVSGAEEPLKTRRPGEETQARPLKPVTDEYVQEEAREPSGRYWLGRDEDGAPKICFDHPDQTEEAPEKPEDIPDMDALNQGKSAEAPEKNSSDKNVKGCTCNTDKVDREIEKLKKQKQELEQQINGEKDETKVENLKVKLAQVERELKQKDNDTYRRQHAVYTFS